MEAHTASHRVEVDDEGRATQIHILSFGRPHMRALHFSWFSFLAAFTGWFAISPLIPTLQQDLALTDDDVAKANITSVAATILARIVVGPLCDRWGPRRVMAALLIIGAVPTGLAGLVTNGTGLVALRFFIGILGATFVPCQFWTTQMFSPNVIGAANATAAGWGNMGGGLTYLIMPLIFNALSLQLPAHDAWRVAYVIPALICIVIGILDLYAADDCPEGDWLVRRKHRAALRLTEQRGADVKTTDHLTPTTPAKPTLTTPTPDEEDETLVEEPFEGARASTAAVLAALSDVNVWVLMLQYALSFGLELAVDNVIAAFFRSRFGLDQTTAALLGSVFGLMNIFSRVSGGLISDALARRASRPAQGRILAQLGILTFEGLSLVTFSRVTGTLHGTMAMLVVFSFFTQAACGTTYALVPFVMPRTAGVVSGLVGAGGNAGGLVLNYVFKAYGTDMEGAFLMIGCVTLGVSLLCGIIRIQGRMLWHILSEERGE